jgi:hypothetical protein
MKHLFTLLVLMVGLMMPLSGQSLPTIDDIQTVTIDEDAGQQTVTLTGITDGDVDAVQEVTVTASSDLAVFSQLAVTGDGASRSLVYQTNPDDSGDANITVRVTDPDGYVEKTFLISVTPVNDVPTLDPIDDVAVEVNPGIIQVPLTGIGSGAANESDDLLFSFYSSNQDLVTGFSIDYTAGASTGTLNITVADQLTGSSNIRISIMDGTVFGVAENVDVYFNLIVSPATAIEPESAGSFMVFPNPATDLLKATLPNATGKPVQVSVYALDGTRVLSRSFADDAIQLPLSQLSSGWYNLVIESEQGVYKERFLKK